MARLHPGIRSVITAAVFLAVVIVALILLSALYTAVVPWERTPWGGVEAQGLIVGHESVRREEGLVYAVVTFSTEDNEYRFVDRSPLVAADYPVGASVAIIYDPLNPREARVGSYADLAFNAAMITLVALIVVVGFVRAMSPRRQ